MLSRDNNNIIKNNKANNLITMKITSDMIKLDCNRSSSFWISMAATRLATRDSVKKKNNHNTE